MGSWGRDKNVLATREVFGASFGWLYLFVLISIPYLCSVSLLFFLKMWRVLLRGTPLLTCFVLLFFCPWIGLGQSDSVRYAAQDTLLSAEELRDDLLEQILEQGFVDEVVAGEVLGEFASDLALRIEVNSVTEEELVATGLVTSYAAHQFILARHHLGGAFYSLRELKQIEGWDVRTLRRILPYLTLTPPQNQSHILRSLGRGTLSGQCSFGTAQGDFAAKFQTLGTPRSLDLRARYYVRRRLSLGVLAASQRGEPMLQPNYPLLDRMGFHLSLNLPEYALRQLIVGDFRLKMGLGLVAYQGFLRVRSCA